MARCSPNATYTRTRLRDTNVVTFHVVALDTQLSGLRANITHVEKLAEPGSFGTQCTGFDANSEQHCIVGHPRISFRFGGVELIDCVFVFVFALFCFLVLVQALANSLAKFEEMQGAFLSAQFPEVLSSQARHIAETVESKTQLSSATAFGGVDQDLQPAVASLQQYQILCRGVHDRLGSSYHLNSICDDFAQLVQGALSVPAASPESTQANGSPSNRPHMPLLAQDLESLAKTSYKDAEHAMAMAAGEYRSDRRLLQPQGIGLPSGEKQPRHRHGSRTPSPLRVAARQARNRSPRSQGDTADNTTEWLHGGVGSPGARSPKSPATAALEAETRRAVAAVAVCTSQLKEVQSAIEELRDAHLQHRLDAAAQEQERAEWLKTLSGGPDSETFTMEVGAVPDNTSISNEDKQLTFTEDAIAAEKGAAFARATARALREVEVELTNTEVGTPAELEKSSMLVLGGQLPSSETEEAEKQNPIANEATAFIGTVSSLNLRTGSTPRDTSLDSGVSPKGRCVTC